MRHENRPWRNATLVLAAALVCAPAALWSRHGLPIDTPAHAQFARRGTLDRSGGADAAIMAAQAIVMKRLEATQFDWTQENASDQAAAQVSRVASTIIRNYRPYAVPDRTERPQPRQRMIPPDEAQQP